MKRVIAFANILVVFISLNAVAQEVGTHGAVSLSGHCPDPCEAEVHYAN